MNTRIVFLAVLGLLGGCATRSDQNRTAAIVKPGLIMVPADQLKYYTPRRDVAEAEAAGSVSPMDTRAVQIEAPVIAQQWNRYADPARPDELMHEAHLVYRREGRTRWRLRAPAGDQQILIGPQTTDGRGEIQSLASQELESYLRDARTNLRREQDVMTRLTEGLQHVSEQQEKLATEVTRLRAEQRGQTLNETAGPPDARARADTETKSANSDSPTIPGSGNTNTK